MSFARRTLTATVLAAAALVTTAPSPAGAVATVVPKAHTIFPAAIEVMPPYQPQTFCDPVAKPGTLALAHVLTSTYAGTAIVSLTRPCSSDTSEHYDGRAIDWGVDHRNTKQRTQGQAFLQWLFAPDSSGDRFAMVRRLGVMYVIWNHRIWGAYSQRWEPYTNCSGPTACHVDHMHISLDWSGAMKKTSFWTGDVAAPMDPPLQTIQPGQTVTEQVSARYAPTPAYRVLAGARYQLTVTGTYTYDGQRHHRADAECSTTDGRHWSPRSTNEAYSDAGALRLWVNGRHSWQSATGSSCATAHHRYTQTVTFTKKAPLTLSIDNPSAQWGADGSLTVTVHRLH